MKKISNPIIVFTILSLLLASCSFDALSGATSTPEATSTTAATSTNTPKPTKTPVPTRTPNLAATQQYEDWQAEIQAFAEKGYIPSADGKIEKVKDFNESWAFLDYYTRWDIGETAENFVFSATYKWSSDSATPNQSGCGFLFALQDNGDDYEVFIDRGEIIFLRTEGNRGYYVGKTRGSTFLDVKEPYEVEFTIIVYDYYAYIILDGEVAAEYTLAKSFDLTGELGFSILSGTNAGYGTRCEVTNGRLWRPNN